MEFLIDACLPRDFGPVIVSLGHKAIDVRDIGMGNAKDPQIAEYSLANKLCLLTEDWGFADVRTYPPENYFGIVVCEAPDSSVDGKLLVMRNLFANTHMIAALPGRLAIVTATRIRLRPPL